MCLSGIEKIEKLSKGLHHACGAIVTEDARAAQLQRLNGAMDFITKHFAILSVATVVFGATAAIIFIAAYLRVFDWRIIWIIEYGDILKIGLITVALFSGFAYYIWMATRDAINLATERARSWLWVWLFGFQSGTRRWIP